MKLSKEGLVLARRLEVRENSAESNYLLDQRRRRLGSKRRSHISLSPLFRNERQSAIADCILPQSTFKKAATRQRERTMDTAARRQQPSIWSQQSTLKWMQCAFGPQNIWTCYVRQIPLEDGKRTRAQFSLLVFCMKFFPRLGSALSTSTDSIG